MADLFPKPAAAFGAARTIVARELASLARARIAFNAVPGEDEYSSPDPVERVVLAVLAAPRDPAHHPDQRWCQPGDVRERKWILTFEDADRGIATFDNEADAREGFRKASDGGWNCYLFAAAPLLDAAAPPSASAARIAIEVDAERRSGSPVLAGTGFTISQMLAELSETNGPVEVASNFDLGTGQIRQALNELASLIDRQAARIAELTAERKEYADELFNLRMRCGCGPDQEGEDVWTRIAALEKALAAAEKLNKHNVERAQNTAAQHGNDPLYRDYMPSEQAVLDEAFQEYYASSLLSTKEGDNG